ncbi:hypothetical protein GN244_ATG19542 [Phytophthora infestans]|uniref:Uncharacterized protein n=1 Tax=Phytophthora infestans TaxID=4787 RepID=A0A833S746_PHYIN|nr:hypothetical protein GN244_ATG19542 [Phytophthora infestans]
MDADHTMDNTSAAPPTQYAQQISAADFDRQAVEYTTQEVERLNAAVRAQPELGEIVAAVDVTQEALNNGPVVRTVAELDEDVDSDDEGEEDAEGYDEEEDEAVRNAFYSADQQDGMVVDDAHVNAFMEDVEMEMAAVAIDEQKLLSAASQRQ